MRYYSKYKKNKKKNGKFSELERISERKSDNIGMKNGFRHVREMKPDQ